MNHDPATRCSAARAAAADARPILIIPYMWIGDFVRCHTAVRVLNARFPGRPVDMLSTARTLPLADYMPGLRKAVLADLPRGRLGLAQQRDLANRLRQEGYGSVLVMPRTWKSALAPYLAGIPQRTGFVGEGRFILLNDLRWGERKLERMIDRKVALTLPDGAPLPADYPAPQLRVPPAEVAAWQAARPSGGAAVALCPATVGPGRSWPVGSLCGTRAGAHRSRQPRLGSGERRRSSPGDEDRARRRVRRAGPDRAGPAHRDPGARRRRCGGGERFRPAARGGGPGGAGRRDFRSDPAVPHRTAQSAGRGDRGRGRDLHDLRAAGLPAPRPSAHRRRPACACARRRARGARAPAPAPG